MAYDESCSLYKFKTSDVVSLNDFSDIYPVGINFNRRGLCVKSGILFVQSYMTVQCTLIKTASVFSTEILLILHCRMHSCCKVCEFVLC